MAPVRSGIFQPETVKAARANPGGIPMIQTHTNRSDPPAEALTDLIRQHGGGRVLATLLRLLLRARRPRPAHPPDLSRLGPHLLRDIGLEPALPAPPLPALLAPGRAAC